MSRPAIAVFGSSEPLPGAPLYEQALRLGRLLAEAGHPVVTGGYGGVMEAASRGAREAGGQTIGETCEIFRDRKPNGYVDREIATADLHARTQRLIELSAGFVILSGKAGTLSELALLWALQRAGCLAERRVVLLGDPWRELLRFLAERDLLEPAQLSVTRVAETPEQAVRELGGGPPAPKER